jgi:hypothetical protein
LFIAMDHTRAEFNRLANWLCWPVRWDWVCELRAHPDLYSEQLERAFERYDNLLAVLQPISVRTPSFTRRSSWRWRMAWDFWPVLEASAMTWCFGVNSTSGFLTFGGGLRARRTTKIATNGTYKQRMPLSPPQAPPSHPKSTSDEFFSFLERK